ncbi:MAG: glutamate--tRNA ligase [Pseudomonadota bacterium]|nr:glutamate--tRNA ligase [Pseudomonadota bacterium]
MLRFAPSPTGFLHMGNVRVALLNYLYAKKNNLNFFLRIDDTDRERSKKEYVDSIIDDLKWLGIDFSNVIRQSDRAKKYNDIFIYLKKKNFIYPCFETPEELSLKRKILLKQGKPPIYDRTSLNLKKSEISSLINSGSNPHWRLKLDDKSISWKDMIHGTITFKDLSISDPVVFRSDEMPLFTITSVIDDADMKVSHILRGDDHITNTAAQIKLFKILDSAIPNFGHFPLMKALSGKGLSKRSESFSIKEFRRKKIFTIVILSYLKRIGTNQPIEEIDNLDSLIKSFDLQGFSKNSVFFNPEDIERLNSKYIKTIDYENLKEKFDIKFDSFFWEIIKPNVDSIQEASDWFDLLNNNFEQKERIMVKKDIKSLIIKYIPKKIDKDSWSMWTKQILENCDIKPKDLYTTLRTILTGKKFGPSMNSLLTLIVKDEIIKRVESNCEEEN